MSLRITPENSDNSQRAIFFELVRFFVRKSLLKVIFNKVILYINFIEVGEGGMHQATSQTSFWELYIRLEINEKERPKEGWKVLERTPQGLEEVRTKRNRPVKYRFFADLLNWVEANRKGYAINVDCLEYGGRLTLQQ